ncbi:MAG TPA: hypothetical protein VEI50_04750 [Nitrospiraceae bacterium]|nr:hypothetical protein [Nitrospiraceae bacterium]
MSHLTSTYVGQIRTVRRREVSNEAEQPRAANRFVIATPTAARDTLIDVVQVSR